MTEVCREAELIATGEPILGFQSMFNAAIKASRIKLLSFILSGFFSLAEEILNINIILFSNFLLIFLVTLVPYSQ